MRRKSIPEEAGVLHDESVTLTRLVDTRHSIATLGIDREEIAAGPSSGRLSRENPERFSQHASMFSAQKLHGMLPATCNYSVTIDVIRPSVFSALKFRP